MKSQLVMLGSVYLCLSLPGRSRSHALLNERRSKDKPTKGSVVGRVGVSERIGDGCMVCVKYPVVVMCCDGRRPVSGKHHRRRHGRCCY